MIETCAAEEAVISAMLCFPGCIQSVAEIITEDDLHKEDLRAIYQAITDHQQGGLPIEVPALATTIGKRRKSAVQTMVELLDVASTGETATWYARKVLLASRARQITALAVELQNHPDRTNEIISHIQALQQLPPVQATRSQFLCATEVLLQTIEIKKLIGKIIERGTTGQLFGPSGDGKTFVALDMFLSVGTGGVWNGIQCEQGIVLYFAGEGHAGLKRRVQAWHQQHQAPNLSNVHISRSVITFDAAGLSQVVKEAQALESQTGKKVALLVIDTLARHLLGDENSTRDMSDFVRAVDGLRDAFPESTAIVVHHTGNDAEKVGRSRGSSALKAACDFEIQCAKGLLTYTKVKDGEQPAPVEFKLVPVQIGEDEDGEPITSCIVQYGERSAKNREVVLTANEGTLLSLVNDYPNILIGDLRSVFYDKRREREPDAKTNTLKNAFLRAFQGLIEKQAIQESGNKVIPYSVEPSHRHKPSQNDDMTGSVTPSQTVTPLRGGVTSVTGTETLIIPSFSEADFEGVVA